MKDKTISQFNIEELRLVLTKVNSLDESFLKHAYNNVSAFEEIIAEIAKQLKNVLDQIDNQ